MNLKTINVESLDEIIDLFDGVDGRLCNFIMGIYVCQSRSKIHIMSEVNYFGFLTRIEKRNVSYFELHEISSKEYIDELKAAVNQYAFKRSSKTNFVRKLW